MGIRKGAVGDCAQPRRSRRPRPASHRPSRGGDDSASRWATT